MKVPAYLTPLRRYDNQAAAGENHSRLLVMPGQKRENASVAADGGSASRVETKEDRRRYDVTPIVFHPDVKHRHGALERSGERAGEE